LTKKLSGLKDTETGDVAINHVFDRDKIPPGPYIENCPDFIVGYNEGYRASWDSVTGVVNTTIFEDNRKAWSGDHCIDPRIVPGIIFSNFKINTQEPSIIDIAPTALELFGVKIPPHMDGQVFIDTETSTKP
jgi:predicted AlkP superfamily phosphohydrolase/phosphomutase